MLKIVNRAESKFFIYSLEWKYGRVHHCCELDYSEFIKIIDPQVVTTNIVGSVPPSNYIKLPTCLNKHTLDLLCSMPLEINTCYEESSETYREKTY
jgi:hypothetical protein